MTAGGRRPGEASEGGDFMSFDGNEQRRSDVLVEAAVSARLREGTDGEDGL